MKTADDVLSVLDLSAADETKPFHLRVGDVGLTVLCPDPLRTALTTYFSETLSDTPGAITVHLLPGQALPVEPNWTEWSREPGKAGRKDAVYDLAGGRLIRKVRSGVTFLQSMDHAVAFGPLEENASTVINFLNTQVLSDRLRAGWQLCHAAAATRGGHTLAIAGLSGGGKSTSILRLMDIDGTAFVSNDRLLVEPGTPPRAMGIPKHPRINPGTILGNPRLHQMLSDTRRADLRALPPADLWALEDKHDLMIGDIYGQGRMCFAAPLTDFWVLNWSHDTTETTQICPVDLDTRPDLLGAIMKSPGPFYQYTDGTFEPNGASLDHAPYLEALRGVRVSEVRGHVDFDVLAQAGRQILG